MKHGCALALLLAVGLAVMAGGGASRAQAPPDLTGVWTDYVDPQQPNPLAGGQGGLAPGLPFTDEARRKSDAYRKLVSTSGDTPGGFCLGPGMPSLVLGGATYPMEIVQRPEQITILYELHNDVRRIYFGARNAPESDRLPFRNGYSTGRWEGDTLVVDTTHLVEQVDQRYPHSAQARVVERYHLATGAKGERVLVIDVTMTDPVFYTKPVAFQKQWMAVANGHLLPYDCAEEPWRLRLEQLERAAAGPAAR
jgi:hypothetical protein